MKRLLSFPAGLVVAVALLTAVGCTTPQPSAPAPAVKSVPSDDKLARELLEKAVAAMGGPVVVDGVRTLVLVGKLQQRSPLGEYTAGVTTTILYPTSFRRDVTLPAAGTISSVLTPEGAFMTGMFGTFELEQAERDGLEATAMRNPISLLKARKDPLFRVSTGGPLLPGTPGNILFVRFGSSETTLLLDADGHIVEVAYTGTAPFDTSKKTSARVVYSDFRTVSGLTFPFASEGWMGDQKLSTGQLDEVRVNGEVAADLFRMPAPAASPTPAAR